MLIFEVICVPLKAAKIFLHYKNSHAYGITHGTPGFRHNRIAGMFGGWG